MKKIILVTIVFLMVVGILLVPTLARADSVANASAEEKVITVKLLMLSPRAIRIELDRPIVDTFGLTPIRDKQESMSHKIEAIPEVKGAATSENRIWIILNDDLDYKLTRLLFKLSLVIMEHFDAASINLEDVATKP